MNNPIENLEDIIEENSITKYKDDIDDMKINDKELIKKIIESIIKKEKNK